MTKDAKVKREAVIKAADMADVRKEENDACAKDYRLVFDFGFA